MIGTKIGIAKVLAGKRLNPAAQAAERGTFSQLGASLKPIFKSGKRIMDTLENPTGTISEQLAKRMKKKKKDATPQP